MGRDRNGAVRRLHQGTTVKGISIALQIAGSIIERSARSWIHAKVGEELAQTGELPAVRQALAATTLDHHKAWVHRALAVALAHTGDTVAAVRHAEGHLPGVDLARALAGIVEAQLQHGDIAGALKTAGKIGTWGYEKTPKADALRAVAAAQATASDSAGSKRTFEKARHLARRLPASDIKGSSPQATGLESIALIQARLGDLEGALRTIEDIDRGSFKVDGLLAVAKAQIEAGDRAGSERLLDRAAETARALGEQDWGSSALQRVATAHARIGNVAAAHAAAKRDPRHAKERLCQGPRPSQRRGCLSFFKDDRSSRQCPDGGVAPRRSHGRF